MTKKHLYAAGAIAAGLAALYFLTRAAKPAAPPATPGLTFFPGLGYVPMGDSLAPHPATIVTGNVTEGDGLTVVGTFG